MRILLIAPETPGPKKKKAKVVPFPQLSLPLLAALTPGEHRVRIVDERLEEIPWDEPWDLAGITVMTATAPRAYELARSLRDRRVKVVLGGSHPTALPEEAAQHADSVVIGEAEGLWEELLQDAGRGRLRRFYRRDMPPSLAGLPSPRLDLLTGRYFLKQVYQTTRGCPHNCTFCSVSTVMGRKYRHRPVEEVIEEVRRSPGRLVGFLDDNIVGDPAYAEEFFAALAPLKKRWVSQGTVRMAENEELLRRAATSGCLGLFVGLESINEESLRQMRKTFNRIDRYGKLVERFHAHGIMVIGSFVFGFDQDDPSVFKRTLRFIEDTRIDFAQFSILTPLPGTDLFTKLKAEDRIFSYDWSRYDFAHVVYRPARMSPRELQDGYNFVFRSFYSWPRIAKGIARHWRYLPHVLRTKLYYSWVSRHPKLLSEKA
ncbi:MAG: radical SAM protein [Clostridia bacterium]|nr:B12-binding domain-containing radical SAM protein [Clostridia bacterium]MDH7572988.1 radical SAM protein [Clostridia bacterium]